MMISTSLRNFREPTKDEQTQIFFSVPPSTLTDPKLHDIEKVDISAVLTLGDAEEESYVSAASLACDRVL